MKTFLKIILKVNGKIMPDILRNIPFKHMDDVKLVINHVVRYKLQGLTCEGIIIDHGGTNSNNVKILSNVNSRNDIQCIDFINKDKILYDVSDNFFKGII